MCKLTDRIIVSTKEMTIASFNACSLEQNLYEEGQNNPNWLSMFDVTTLTPKSANGPSYKASWATRHRSLLASVCGVL